MSAGKSVPQKRTKTSAVSKRTTAASKTTKAAKPKTMTAGAGTVGETAAKRKRAKT